MLTTNISLLRRCFALSKGRSFLRGFLLNLNEDFVVEFDDAYNSRYAFVLFRDGIVSLLVLQEVLQFALANFASVEEQLFAMFPLIMLVLACGCRHEIRRKTRDIRVLLNGLIGMEFQFKRHISNFARHQTILERLVLLFTDCANISALFISIFFSYVIHWQNPCQVTLSGYYLLGSCGSASGPDDSYLFHLCKHGLLIVNFWMWMYCFMAAGFGVSVLTALSPLSLKRGIKM